MLSFFKKNKKNTWLYHYFTHVHQKSQSYDVRFLRFFVTFGHFLPSHSPDDPENQNFEQLKKTPGDIVILHMCIINDNHIMYGS